jgi:CheY-like chemotaxis protein
MDSSGFMQILVADDQPVTLSALTTLLNNRGYQAVAVRSGTAAWEVLQRNDAPSLAVFDCNMPGMSGTELCRAARTAFPERPLHIILISASCHAVEQKVAGLSAGADDYLISPFAPSELLARVRVGERLIKLQIELRKKLSELEKALAQVRQLQGLLPICMDCKKIRDDQNYWHQVEHYIMRHADVSFTHGICPSCFEKRRGMLAVYQSATSAQKVPVPE